MSPPSYHEPGRLVAAEIHRVLDDSPMTQSIRLTPTEPVEAKMPDGVEKTTDRDQHTLFWNETNRNGMGLH